MTRIHPSAILSPKAQLDEDVEVGPYSIVGEDVVIESGCSLMSHVVIEGPRRIGRNNRFHPFTSIGGPPQDKKYRGEQTALLIGHGNVFREGVTVNRGTAQDQGLTQIGHDNWVMAYVHIAHDCLIGDHCVLANSVNLAGHVRLGDYSVLGGYTGVHQYCQVGAHVMAGIASVIVKDVPPYLMISGNAAKPYGLNREGLKRRGFSESRLKSMQESYRILYREGLRFEESLEHLRLQWHKLKQEGLIEEAEDLALSLRFLEATSRGIIRP
ncbi:MAG TPA: acyl-[acyl-carrier-protein]--UDP-N-acetylglucosamine O-acyltransferase [Lautropia sp.]|nr:acyl-[acyl-carrier-protein]--UDP-N-acetylglucosamine O-acyltransferase [Lautropia sp.]